MVIGLLTNTIFLFREYLKIRTIINWPIVLLFVVKMEQSMANDFSSTVSNYWHSRTYDFEEGDTRQPFYDEALPDFALGMLFILWHIEMYPTYVKTERPWELAWTRLTREKSVYSKIRSNLELYSEESSQLKYSINAVKWMQSWNKIWTGQANGELLIWNGYDLQFEAAGWSFEDSIHVIKFIKDETWAIIADK